MRTIGDSQFRKPIATTEIGWNRPNYVWQNC